MAYYDHDRNVSHILGFAALIVIGSSPGAWKRSGRRPGVPMGAILKFSENSLILYEPDILCFFSLGKFAV
jgi:hypothetical protein